jgi:Fe-S-cluster containining protein
MSSDAGPEEDSRARINLQMMGETRAFVVPVPRGQRLPLDLLPTARELTQQAASVAVAQAVAEGKQISCKAGCGACCRQLVAVSLIEARALADLVAALPAERKAAVRARFADAARRLEEAGMLDPNGRPGVRALQGAEGPELGLRYWALQIACPFLEDESCSIHADRPTVCREYHVTSPAENCRRLGENVIDAVVPPLHLNRALAVAGARLADLPPYTVPLVLALEKAELHADALRRPLDGEMMFVTLLRIIDYQARRPFDERTPE